MIAYAIPLILPYLSSTDNSISGSIATVEVEFNDAGELLDSPCAARALGASSSLTIDLLIPVARFPEEFGYEMATSNPC